MCTRKEAVGGDGKEGTASCSQHGVERTRSPSHRGILCMVLLGSVAWLVVALHPPLLMPLPEQWSLTSHPLAIYLRLPLSAWVMAATCTLMWKLSNQAEAVGQKFVAKWLSDLPFFMYTVIAVMMTTWSFDLDPSQTPPPSSAFQQLTTPWIRRLRKWPFPVFTPPFLLPLLRPPGWPAGSLPAAWWALASCTLLWLLVQGLPRALGLLWVRVQERGWSRGPLAEPLLPYPVDGAQHKGECMHLTAALVAATTAIVASSVGAGVTWTAALLLGLGAAVVCLYRGLVIMSAWQQLDAAEKAAADAELEKGAGKASLRPQQHVAGNQRS